VVVRSFASDDLDGVLTLCRAEGWSTLPADPTRAHRVLTAPGAVSISALDDGAVVGFATALSDGAIDAYLSLLVVAAAHRRRGIGRQLVAEVFRLSGAQRLNLLSEERAQGFYESLPHRRAPGYRLYP
jgi:ribosomal protein S18 acetylase RimI-like enzyme